MYELLVMLKEGDERLEEARVVARRSKYGVLNYLQQCWQAEQERGARPVAWGRRIGGSVNDGGMTMGDYTMVMAEDGSYAYLVRRRPVY